MYLDFLTSLHKSTKRDYLKRVNDKDFPKNKAANLAKKWGYHYWDGDRRINYGGYKYIAGRWAKVAKKLIKHYNIKDGDRVLDIGCGKGYLLYEIYKINPKIKVFGLEISKYAIKKSKKEVTKFIKFGNANKLPFKKNYFKLAYSLNTFHNLHNYDLFESLKEIQRVSKKKYICVEAYRNELEKMNLLYWQVTCEAFNTPKEWQWWFDKAKYNGDHSFIYFK
tara:strand:- start:9 stop:674 length:666 start_codon:yes stop_codon:yes gene_type:complete